MYVTANKNKFFLILWPINGLCCEGLWQTRISYEKSFLHNEGKNATSQNLFFFSAMIYPYYLLIELNPIKSFFKCLGKTRANVSTSRIKNGLKNFVFKQYLAGMSLRTKISFFNFFYRFMGRVVKVIDKHGFPTKNPSSITNVKMPLHKNWIFFQTWFILIIPWLSKILSRVFLNFG